jgi:probable O-glycosylation ligase (exosortase A-associated)
MRELLLVMILGAICIATLFSARIGIYGYLWYSLMRPDVLAWANRQNDYSMILAAVVLLAAAVNFPGKFLGMIRNPFVLLLLLFTSAVSLSAIVAVSPALAWSPTWQFLRVILMSMSIVLLLESTNDLRWLVLVMGCSIAVLGFKFGFFGVLHPGARFASGYGGMIGDNNGMALAFAMGIPMVWYGIDLVQNRGVRFGLYMIAFFNAAAVALTYSRGGALALGFGILLIGARARHKLLTVGVVVIAGVAVAGIAGTKYLDRLSTIQTPAEESSAESRIVLAQIGLRMWANYPVMGVGYGRTNQQLLMPAYAPNAEYSIKVLHNTWVQTIVDTGVVGFMPYCALIFGSLLWLAGSIRQTRKWKPEYLAYPLGLQTSLVVFAVGSTFLSVTGYDFLYYLLMAIAVWYRVYQREVVPLRDKRRTPASPATTPRATITRALPRIPQPIGLR